MSNIEAVRSSPRLLSLRASGTKSLGLPDILMILGGLAVCLPYLLLPVIPGTDYPNHLARLAVLGAAPESPILRNFAPHWVLIPDLGIDLVYMVLKPLASPEAALRLCLVGSLLLTLLAFRGMQRVLFGRTTAAALLAPLFVAGLPVQMGYINFVMSSALVMTGAWLCLAWRDHFSTARVFGLACLAGLVWLCHFAGFAALMIFLPCVLLRAHARGFRPVPLLRAGLICAIIALPGLVMTILAEPETGHTEVEYGIVSLRSLIAPVMSTGRPFDYLVWLGSIMILVALLRFGTWRVAPPARAGVLVLLLVAACLPWRLGIANFDVGSRLIVLAWLLFLAASRIDLPPRPPGRILIIAACLALIVQRDRVIIGLSAHEDAVVNAFRAAAQKMPEGATLMQATDVWRAADCTRASSALSSMGPQTHLAAYATRDRGVWEPLIFAASGKQPIRSLRDFAPASLRALVPPALDRLVPLSPDGRAPPDTAAPAERLPPGWPEKYDFLLVTGRGCTKNPDPLVLIERASGPGFLLYQLRHSSGL